MNIDYSKDFTCGKYKHYKGNYYTVYGLAIDTEDNPYIIYRAEYDDKKFWIRPYKMFFEKIKYNENYIERFHKTNKNNINRKEAINELRKILDEGIQFITHSETCEQFVIFSIETKPYPIIYISNEIRANSSSYLTDFQIAYRMNWYIYNFDEKIQYCKIKEPIKKDSSFIVKNADYDEKKILEKQLNPCSVDLRITDNFFFKSKHTKIDLTSINNLKTAKKLWKKKKLYINGKETFFKLRPGESVVTHTYEEIQIPADCAGKIEIKSTYARLSLSVTTADFCNPGWKGYFPLVLRNDGNNTIYLHPKEKMIQIMLIPTVSPIITEYKKNSTYMNDDGTPFKFWNAKTIDYQGKLISDEKLKNFYNSLLSSYEDVEVQERIEDTFLKYCEKNKNKSKNQNHENQLDLEKIYNGYIRREKRLKILSSLPSKIATLIIAIIGIVLDVLTWTIDNPINIIKEHLFEIRLILSFVGIIGIAFFTLIIIVSPKVFCTEKRHMKLK